MVPVGAGLLRPEAVGMMLTGTHGVLRETGHSVLCVRHVYAVPVDAHAVLYVLVEERHLDELALADAQLRAGGLAVERPGLDGLAGAEPYPFLFGGEGKPAGRPSLLGGGRPGQAHRRPAVGVLRAVSVFVRVPRTVAERRTAAVVHVLVGHHAEP